MRFIFPFAEIEKKSRIILYGASEEGYDFYRQLVSSAYCEIVLWVDRQYEWYRLLNLPVEPPNSILNVDYDIIVLTAEKETIAESMTNDLVRMGIDKKKILWKSNCLINGNIAAKYDADRVIKEADGALQAEPSKYLKDDMLDVVIRILYATDIILARNSEKHRCMYQKLMMVQNDGKEPTENMIQAYFTEYSMKRGWKAFDESFCNLIESMRKQGFKKNNFIPIDKKGNLINGRHRLAVAMALKIPVWVRQYPFDGLRLRFDDKWLKDNGFSEDEIAEIIVAYKELKVEV